MYNKVLEYNLLIYIHIVVLNIINGNFRLVRSWQKSPRPIGARILSVPFRSHSKPHTKAQLEWPKRLTQLDNQLYIRRETCSFIREWNGVYVSVSYSLIFLEHIHINWLSDNTSWAWISPHQGTHSCSQILKLT